MIIQTRQVLKKYINGSEKQELDHKIQKYCCEKMEYAIEKCFFLYKNKPDPGIYVAHNTSMIGVHWEYIKLTYCPFCSEQMKIDNLDQITLVEQPKWKNEEEE